MSGIPKSARPHHWGFANAWLRRSFQRIPETLVSAIANARSADPVIEAWENFAKTLDEEERLSPEGMEASAFTAPSDDGPWYIAVVTFPAPKHAHEAYMAALAVRPPDAPLDPEREDDAPAPGTDLRYILLERADDPGDVTWVEWIDDEDETLDAPAEIEPPPARETFVKIVADLLD